MNLLIVVNDFRPNRLKMILCGLIAVSLFDAIFRYYITHNDNMLDFRGTMILQTKAIYYLTINTKTQYCSLFCIDVL